MEQKRIRIGGLSIDWKRAVYRVFFFMEDLALTEKVLPEIEGFLLRYARKTNVPLLTIREEPFSFCGVSFTLEEFLHYVDARRAFGEYVLLIRPELFRDRSAALCALGLWRRSRKRGTPAFAVYTPLVQKDWHQDFEADAFSRFYLFRSGQVIPLQLLAQGKYGNTLVAELFPGVQAVYWEEPLSTFPVS